MLFGKKSLERPDYGKADYYQQHTETDFHWPEDACGSFLDKSLPPVNFRHRPSIERMIALPLMTTIAKTKTRLCPICQGAGLKDGMRCNACAGTGEIPQAK